MGKATAQHPETLIKRGRVVAKVDAIEELKLEVPAEGRIVSLKEDGRGGDFRFVVGDYSSLVNEDTYEAVFIASNLVGSSVGVWKRVGIDGVLDARWWGMWPTDDYAVATDSDDGLGKMIAFAKRAQESDSGLSGNPDIGMTLYFPRVGAAADYKFSCANGVHLIDFDNVRIKTDPGVRLIKDSGNANGYPLFQFGVMDLGANGSRIDSSSVSVTNVDLSHIEIRCEDRQTAGLYAGSVEGCVVHVEDCNDLNTEGALIIAGADARANGVIGGMLVRRVQHWRGGPKIKHFTNYDVMFDSRDDATGHIAWPKVELGMRGDVSLAEPDKGACILFRGYSDFPSNVNGFWVGHADVIENNGSESPELVNYFVRVQQFDNPIDMGVPTNKGVVVNGRVDSAQTEGMHTLICNEGTNCDLTFGTLNTFKTKTRRRVAYDGGEGKGSLSIQTLIVQGGKAGGEPLVDWIGELDIGRVKLESGSITDGELFNVDMGKASFSRDYYPQDSVHWYSFNSIVRGEDLTLEAGQISISSNYHRVLNEGGAATDNLLNIVPPANVKDGMLLYLRAAADSQDVVLVHGAGNIWLDGEAEKVLSRRNDRIVLMWDGDLLSWLQISFGDNRV